MDIREGLVLVNQLVRAIDRQTKAKLLAGVQSPSDKAEAVRKQGEMIIGEMTYDEAFRDHLLNQLKAQDTLKETRGK